MAIAAADCDFLGGEAENHHVVRTDPVANFDIGAIERADREGAIERELEKMHIKELSIQAVSQAVINIRSSKLPDPAKIGNAGSFFKNPTISSEKFRVLERNHLNMPHYIIDDRRIKIPAAWLIEQCGWKGYRKADAGVHIYQPLVLVNYNNANGRDIYKLSEQIQHSVKDKFGIELEREVNII